MYAALARQIAGSPNPEKAGPILNELRAKLRERVPSEEEFLALFPELIYTNKISKQRALVKYVLAKIARHSGQSFSADMDDLTIEHLHPQSKIDAAPWTDELAGQLGNLILVTKSTNEKLENKSFSEKKSILRSAKYHDALPDYFWNATDLTPDLVQRRTRELAKLAYTKVWKI